MKIEELLCMRNVFSFVHSDETYARILSSGMATTGATVRIWQDRLLWGRSIVDVCAERAIIEIEVENFFGSAMDALLFVLAKETRTMGWNQSELCEIISFAQEQRLDPLPILAILGSTETELHKTKQILSLPEYLREQLGKEKTDLKTALKSVSLSEQLLRLVFENPEYSFSKRRQMLSWLEETDLPMEIPSQWEAGTLFFEWLKKIRYPMLSKLEEKFASVGSRYCGGRNIQLKAPEYFEGNTFSATVKFSSRKQLEKAVKGLENLAENYDELLELLQ